MMRMLIAAGAVRKALENLPLLHRAESIPASLVSLEHKKLLRQFIGTVADQFVVIS